jgi:hypothetical protein
MNKLYENLTTVRISRRFAPRNSVTVAIQEQEDPFAYGIVTNISPSGACLVTAKPLPTGSKVHLQVSFYQQADLFVTDARVVWSRDDRRSLEKDDPLKGFIIHGVEFSGLPTNQRARLLHMLDSPDFQLVYSPNNGEFDSLMSELGDDLKQLGSKFTRETGGKESKGQEN